MDPQFITQGHLPPLTRRNILSLAAMLSAPSLMESAEPTETDSSREIASFLNIEAGELPIILSAPHGGRERPDLIPDRKTGVFAFDTNTQELARACAKAFHERLGKRIHLIICKLHRTKLDCNREPEEATAGNPIATEVWKRYHNAITRAAQQIRTQHRSGILIDLHGHGHKSQTLELGYALEAEDLALPDSTLNSPQLMQKSTLRYLLEKHHTSHSDLLRGPESLGAFFEKAGYRSTPSPRIPIPTSPFFSGGYTIRRHTEENPHLTAIQIETHSPGVRDTPQNRAAFADALVSVCESFLRIHLDQNLPSHPPTPPPQKQP